MHAEVTGQTSNPLDEPPGTCVFSIVLVAVDNLVCDDAVDFVLHAQDPLLVVLPVLCIVVFFAFRLAGEAKDIVEGEVDLLVGVGAEGVRYAFHGAEDEEDGFNAGKSR